MEDGKTVVFTVRYAEEDEPVAEARVTLKNEEERDAITGAMLGILASGASHVTVTDSETGDTLLDEVRPVGPTPPGLVA